jgi:hypothetical protein
MNFNIADQLEFQKTFNQTVGDRNYTPSIEVRQLRLALALEELSELAEAFGLKKSFIALMEDKTADFIQKSDGNVEDTLEYNKEEALDAVVDIEVINNGTIVSCGFHNKKSKENQDIELAIYDKAYIEVHSSNMSKACGNFVDACKTVDHYKSLGINTNIEESSTGKYLVKRLDGKVLKNIYYRKANLEQYV